LSSSKVDLCCKLSSLIGYRAREFLDNLFSDSFTDWLMSDAIKLIALTENGCVVGLIWCAKRVALKRASSHNHSVSVNKPSIYCTP
jgi:hypothetical protein